MTSGDGESNMGKVVKKTVTTVEYIRGEQDEDDDREELDLGDEPEDEADADEHKPPRRRK